MKNKNTLLTASAFALFSLAASNAYADQVINDDLIISFSACIGNDCVSGESFGFDTLRLKENNLRIKFQDTSSSASFPTNDWELVANDSTNGGGNYFAIRDVDGGRTPFTVEASAPSHSLYVDDGGRVGLGTSAPVVELHVVDGDSPTLRLEQDGSSGFSAQTWDVAGNEANFFVRDVTNSSKLPLRIRPGASESSIDIAGDGDIGFGTSSPEKPMHLRRNDGTAAMLIEEASSTKDNTRVLFQLQNNGSAKINLVDVSSDTPANWVIATTDGNLVLNEKSNNGTPEFTLAEDGALNVRGDITANNVLLTSDKNLKENLSSIDYLNILKKVADLDISQWNYISENDTTQHIGPMAQDFSAAFGLGQSDKHISSIDLSGVSLAAIKALNQVVEQQSTRINYLQKQIQDLKSKRVEQ